MGKHVGETGERAHTLREWPESEKPRERLLSHGATKLTDVELLAILLRTGARTKERSRTAIDVARELLMSFENSLALLSMRDALELANTSGIGKVKAVTLAAAFEIGRRMQSLPGNDAPLLNNPEAVHKFIMRDFAGEKREVFKVIALSTSGRVKRVKTLTEGTLSASLVDARAVFKFAILEEAASIIVVHNHPSGKLDPSKEDIQITKDLVYSGGFLDIPVHDHLIVGPTGYLSMKNAGYV
ncbi:MAG: DNA repair protein RadC [Bacteroidetes bacterium]|jgi:DNA repair protein RadC|nr:DNA repair protein RadC [Bacteroidota bacterium]